MNSLPKAQSLTALRYALVMLAMYLKASGYLDHVDVDATVNSIVSMVNDAMIVAPIAWGFYTNWRDRQKAKQNLAIAVQAGIAHNAATGAAPATITAAAAQAIIKTYSPSLAPIPGKS